MKTEIDEELRQIEETIKQMPPEKVAYIVIKAFYKCENVTPEFRDEFQAWLASPKNAEAKNMALEKLFYEMFEQQEHTFMTNV